MASCLCDSYIVFYATLQYAFTPDLAYTFFYTSTYSPLHGLLCGSVDERDPFKLMLLRQRTHFAYSNLATGHCLNYIYMTKLNHISSFRHQRFRLRC